MYEASPFLIQAPGVGLRGMGSSSLDFRAIIMIMMKLFVFLVLGSIKYIQNCFESYL